jgi:hypothetical protein
MFPWWGWAIAACCRSRASLVAENLCLRQQLLVLRRRQLRPRLNNFAPYRSRKVGSQGGMKTEGHSTCQM